MTRVGGPISRKIFKLVDSSNEQNYEVKTIRVNHFSSEKFVPTFVKAQPKVNVKALVSVQAKVRGWIARRDFNSKVKQTVSCFAV
jgi:hypothetical protein